MNYARMFMKRTGVLILAGLLFATGCSSQSPEEQVRTTEAKMLEAVTSDHPERACQYEADHDSCIGGMILLKRMKMDPGAVIGIPDDWRKRLKSATVNVTGNRATLNPGPTGKAATFIRRDGRWLNDNTNQSP